MRRTLAGALGVLLAIAASALAQPDTLPPLPTTGTSKADFEPFDQAIRGFMASRGIQAGALAVLYKDEIVYERGYGWIDADLERALPKNTPFRAAGLGEVLTRAAARKLIADGKLRLGTKVVELLPELKPAADSENADERIGAIAVEHLLNERSGWDFTEGFDPVLEPWELAGALDLEQHPGVSDLLRWLAGQKLEEDPDDEVYRTPVHAVLLGELVTRVSGQPLEDYLSRELVRPLRLRSIAPAGVPESARQRGEAWYAHPWTLRSVLADAAGEEVAGAYGGVDFATWRAAFGWIGSAADWARLIAAYGPDGRPPEPHDKWQRYSGVPGAASAAIWRADGLRIVALFNRCADESGEPYEDILEALDKAAARVRRTLR